MDKIEIKLTHIKDEYVDLDNMSKEALSSFISVVNSLKNIAESVEFDDVTFSIRKGSACVSLNSTPQNVGYYYGMMDEAINGKSLNTIVTENMRNIQKEFQNSDGIYHFFCGDIDLAPTIIQAKKITKKRVQKCLSYKLEILTGFFNQIGGNDPNYHFDNGDGDKITIECTINDALELKDFLFKSISTLVISRKDNSLDDKISYQHCAILEKDQLSRIRNFIQLYNKTDNIIDRLDQIFDLVDNSNNRIDDILLLLKLFNNKIFDINEMKTILFLSKNIENSYIQKQRVSLLSLFNSLL